MAFVPDCLGVPPRCLPDILAVTIAAKVCLLRRTLGDPCWCSPWTLAELVLHPTPQQHSTTPTCTTSLSQTPPGPGWAGKRPKIDDFRSYPPPENKTKTTLAALELMLLLRCRPFSRSLFLRAAPACEIFAVDPHSAAVHASRHAGECFKC